MKWYLLFGFMLSFLHVHSQPPVDTISAAYRKQLSISYSAKSVLFLEQLKKLPADKQRFKEYETHYKDIFKAVNEEIKEGRVVYDSVMSAVLEDVLREIKAKNPQVPEDIQALLLRDVEPNAFTFGDSHVFVNIGLLQYLENEDQIAASLSHEVGHLLLRHTIQTLNFKFEKDKTGAADITTIRKADVKKADRAFEWIRSSIYEGGRITREHEIQADSIGYVLVKNTRYRPAAFVEVLEVLARYDSTHAGELEAQTYKQFFDLPGQPFKESWMKVEDFSSYNYGAFTAKFDKDSILSHPDISERIRYMRTTFPELKLQDTTAPISAGYSRFNEVRASAEKERIPNLFFNERYGEVIYTALQYLQKDSENKFYREWLGKSFLRVYEARKNYQLNKYLDRVSPKDQTQSYIQFLSFMWNLKPDEMKIIADFYSVK